MITVTETTHDEATSPVQKPPTSIEEVFAALSQKRRDAAERYRELLLRADDPKKGDADALQECMILLGRQPDDLEADRAVVLSIAAGEEAKAERARLQPLVSAAKAENKAVRDGVERERQMAEAEWKKRLAAAGRAFNAVQAEFMGHADAENQLPTACRRFAQICGLTYHRPDPRVETIVAVDVSIDGKSREQVIGECRKLIAKKAAPPDGVLASNWVNQQLVRGGHAGLDSGEAAEVNSIARPSRYGLVGILRAELVADGGAADMKPADVVKQVQSRFRNEGYRELSADELATFRVEDWPTLASQRAAVTQ